jgi:hypothetical protein
MKQPRKGAGPRNTAASTKSTPQPAPGTRARRQARIRHTSLEKISPDHVITEKISIAMHKSTPAATISSQTTGPGDAPPNEATRNPSESANECKIRGSREARENLSLRARGPRDDSPGSVHAEPAGLPDEKLPFPPGSERI